MFWKSALLQALFYPVLEEHDNRGTTRGSLLHQRFALGLEEPDLANPVSLLHLQRPVVIIQTGGNTHHGGSSGSTVQKDRVKSAAVDNSDSDFESETCNNEKDKKKKKKGKGAAAAANRGKKRKEIQLRGEGEAGVREGESEEESGGEAVDVSCRVVT